MTTNGTPYPANPGQIEYYFESACITVQARIPSCAPSKPTLLSITHISDVAVCLLSACLQTLFHIYVGNSRNARIRSRSRNPLGELRFERKFESSLETCRQRTEVSFFVVRRGILIELRDGSSHQCESNACKCWRRRRQIQTAEWIRLFIKAALRGRRRNYARAFIFGADSACK